MRRYVSFLSVWPVHTFNHQGHVCKSFSKAKAAVLDPKNFITDGTKQLKILSEI